MESYAQEHDHAHMVYLVMQDYKRIIEQLKNSARLSREEKKQQKEELRMKVIDVERAEIIKMYEAGVLPSSSPKS